MCGTVPTCRAAPASKTSWRVVAARLRNATGGRPTPSTSLPTAPTRAQARGEQPAFSGSCTTPERSRCWTPAGTPWLAARTASLPTPHARWRASSRPPHTCCKDALRTPTLRSSDHRLRRDAHRWKGYRFHPTRPTVLSGLIPDRPFRWRRPPYVPCSSAWAAWSPSRLAEESCCELVNSLRGYHLS